MAGLESPITINIFLNDAIKRASTGTTAQAPVKPAVIPKKNKKMDALLLRLTNKDILDETEMTQLTEDVVVFAQDLLKTKQLGELKSFLNQAKHKLSPIMRDMLSDELKSHKL